MSLQPGPEHTAQVARAAFPQGNPDLRLRDELGTIFCDDDFADLDPKRGQPSLAPWRLALVPVLQFRADLSDGQAAEACARGKRVRFYRVTELATQLLEAREERQLTRLNSQLAELDLLVLDERGYVPASKVGTELLFDVISPAYERSSVLVTTHLPFEEWKEVLGSERLREARRRRRGRRPGGADRRRRGRRGVV